MLSGTRCCSQFMPLSRSLFALNRIRLCLSLCTDTGIIFLTCTSGTVIAEENVTGKCLDDKSFSKLFCSPTILPAIHPRSCCVPVYPASFYYLHYNIELRRCIVECFGRWLALLRLCYCFGIVFSIYDLFGVQCGQCACKYPRPIMPAVFVRQLSSLRGIDEELAGGWNGAVCFCREICVFVCTHTHPSVPPTHFRREKLYPHLHKNNWHFKLAFQSKRIIFFSICAGSEHCHIGEYEKEGKREHKRGHVIKA